MVFCNELMTQIEGDFRLLVSDGRISKMVAPGVYALRDGQAEILAHEIESLAGFIEWRGGQALAIGALGRNRGVPAVDALYFPANSDSIENISIKTVATEGLNGMGSLSSALSSARKAIRKCYSSDHLRDVYGFDLVNGELKTRPQREFLEYRKAMLNFLLSALGLNCESEARPISVLIDFSANEHKFPVLLKAAEFFEVPWVGSEEDILFRVDDDRMDMSVVPFPKVLNVSRMARDIRNDDPADKYYFMFANQMLQVSADGVELTKR